MKVFINRLKRAMLKNDESGIYNLGYKGGVQKRVLFSYLVDSLRSSHIDYEFVSNRKECQLILSCLLKHGFIVDFLDCRELFVDKGLQYDYVIGFGDSYRRARLKSGGTRILYLTEGAPCFSLQSERQRCDDFFIRHNNKISIERSYTYYKEEDLVLADKIITLGELHKQYVENKYQKQAYEFYPIGLSVEARKADFKKSKDILWFGSRGIVHKGLDLLIDAVKRMPDWTLHVCGVDRREVDKIMLSPVNVKFYGRINVKGELFKTLIDKCNFKYLLSCSEAVPTSVITVMKSGVIPVVNSNCGTNLKTSFVIDSTDIEKIKEHILQTYSYTESELKKMSANSVEEASFRFNEKTFTETFESIIKDIGET